MKRIKVGLIALFFVLAGFLYADGASAQSYIVNPNKTYTYSNMVSDITKLKKAYPDLITVKTIGKSEYGRNLYAVSLGKGSSKVFINGSHHAREWMTTNVNMNMIDKYAYAYKKNQKIKGYDVRKILTNTTIWFVPMVNPDGVTLQQSGLKAFPKSTHAGLKRMNSGSTNFKRWKANAKGVDLNRQYNANWYRLGGASSPSYMNYNGKAPHSAAETKAIVSFVSSFSPEIAVSYHSSGQIMYWDYGQTGSRRTKDLAIARKLNGMTGYALQGRSYGGGFSDWYSMIKKKSAFTLEIAPFAGQTHVPLYRFPTVWNQNMGVGLYVAQEGGKIYDTRKLAESQALEKKIKAYNATAGKLQTYYTTKIKTTNNVKIEKAHQDLYNKVSSEIKKNEAAIAKLPSKFRSRPAAALKTAKTHRDRSAAFINAVKDGEKLLANNNTLTGYLEKERMTKTSVSRYENLVKMIPSVNSKLAKMYGTSARKLAVAKYITPAIVTRDNLKFEVLRYELIFKMEDQLNKKQYESVKANLTKYDKLTSDSAAFKKSKKYKTYTATEIFLKSKRDKIEGGLPQEPVEQPVPQPETPPAETTNPAGEAK
ncbi:M14 family zinc carboxypeptidase [Peribacillus glennii]|uniref:Peptidase M14 n=1 Tax=Peribacillus glennii TaxID=2303991 RepID=A0A372L8G1_9BACI|nr:M14 family zinc carboxypeptidase [Peribacillus glennii]RFU61145.1 peptidase M14 [Peribacillus glennii]